MARVIDSHPQRDKIIEALLAGESSRKVAVMAGISHNQVAEYRRKVLVPALKNSSKLKALERIPKETLESVRETRDLTKQVLTGDPYLTRIEQHYKDLDETIAEAKADGDRKAIASLVRTSLSGVELHAKLTGRLDTTATSVTNFVICLPDSDADTAPAPIDVEFTETPIESGE